MNMEKKVVGLNILLVPLAIVAGWSFSKATWVGKVGIHILHQELTFLNSWWKGAIFVWLIWILLEIVQFQVWKRCSRKTNLIVQGALILCALVGLIYTYLDFRTFTHSLLGERFHIGGYLFWIVWGAICVVFANQQRVVNTTNFPEV